MWHFVADLHTKFLYVLKLSAFGGDLKNPRASTIHLRRLWRSLKYEEVFLKAYDSVIEARRGIGGWLYFYNEERLHQALGYRTPRAVFAGEACEHVDNPPLRYALLRVIHMLRGTTSREGGINVLTQVNRQSRRFRLPSLLTRSTS